MNVAWRRAVVALILSACGSPSAPDGDPPMAGDIVRAGQGLWSGATGGPFQVHVKSDPGEECGIIFSIGDDTWIGDSRSGRTEAAGVGVLSEGARVEVWFRLVNDSCPGQSHAEAIKRVR